MSGKENQNYFQNADWLSVFIKHYKLLASIFVLTSVVVISITQFIIKPKFSSTAVIYAVPSYGPEAVVPPQHFGSDQDNDAFIQILESMDVKTAVVNKFNLMKHYDIDSTSKKKGFLLEKVYRKNISIDKSSYGSIEVNVIDKSPELAAEIANHIIKVGGELSERIKKINIGIVLEDRKSEYLQKKNEVDSLEQRLSNIGDKVDADNPYDINNIKFIRLKKQFLGELGKLSSKKTKYELAKNHFNANIPAFYSVNNAVPDYEKVYPKTLITLILILVPVMVFAVLLLNILEAVKRAGE